MYKATLDTANNHYEAEGIDSYTALSNLPVTFIDVKYKGIVTLELREKGRRKAKKAERLLQPSQLKRVIVNKLFRSHLANSLDYMLK